MKLYGDFTKEDWLKAFQVEEGQIPTSFLIPDNCDNIIFKGVSYF